MTKRINSNPWINNNNMNYGWMNIEHTKMSGTIRAMLNFSQNIPERCLSTY